MKKIFYAALASTMLFATSCSSDLDEGKTGAGQQATVSVNIGIPTMQTRAYSDGLTAQKLQYAVYEKTANGLVKTELGNLDDEIVLKKQINFKLVTGRTYAFVFWAANENAPYEVTFGNDGATMKYDATELVANEETLDAFYVYQEYTVEGDGTMEAHLRRPFAQVNVGTNDYEDARKANYTPTVSRITFSNVYTELDLVSGEVDGETTDVEYVYNNIPEGEKFPVEGYDYFAMAYVLVPVEQELVEVQFDCSTAEKNGEVRGEHTVGSVPVQRNYRTNIFGQLLTSNTEVNVIIEPEYYEPDYNYSQLKLVAANGGTLVLEEDITLDKAPLEFRKNATIDLNGHTITAPNQALRVWDGATLTIKGDGDFNISGSMAIWVAGGTLIIEGGNFNGTELGEMIYIGGTATIGGTVYIKGGVFNPVEGSGILNCYDPSYTNGIAEFIVTGGVFYGGFNPADSGVDLGPAPEREHANWVPTGYKSIATTIGGKECYVVVPDEVNVAASADELIATLEQGNDVTFFDDITIDPANMSSGYGTTGINVKNGQTIDGNGYTLDIKGANTTWSSGINTNGGIIRNITITGSFRGVFVNHNNDATYSGPVILENVIIDGTTYTISCDQGKNQTLKATNSTFNGWTSYAATLGDVEFIGCNFGKGNGYAFCRPYAPTAFVNCAFASGYQIDTRAVCTFENCTIGGEPLTAENLGTLINDETYIGNAIIK